MGFFLSKWYLDCVADSGDAAVFYWASLSWGPLRLRYGAALLGPIEGKPTHRYTLRPESEPVFAETGRLAWSSDRLEAGGTWTPRAEGIRRTLLDEDHGRVEWHCVCPRAHATVRVGDRAVHGSGYVEHLTMTVKPW